MRLKIVNNLLETSSCKKLPFFRYPKGLIFDFFLNH